MTRGAAPDSLDARRAVEDVSRRTPRSRTYHVGGATMVRMYSQPVNVRRSDGVWNSLDLNLGERRDGRFQPNAGPAVSFAWQADADQLASLQVDPDHRIGYGLDGAGQVPGRRSGATVTYPGVRPGVDARLTATATGSKEVLVLHSPHAPRSFVFPLRLGGLRPELDGDTGAVRLLDSSGRVMATIPPGMMQDSAIDPRSGDPASSRGVTYSLVHQASGGWALRVRLDDRWLDDPRRTYPVTVDPSLQINTGSDDTYVMSPYNNNYSAEPELKVGTFNGGANVAAAYLHFGLASALPDRYIASASLNLTETWSFSCAPSNVSVYSVAAGWSASTMRTYPGARVGSRLATVSTAHGHDAGCPAARVGFPIDPTLATRWTHGATAFDGLTVRASGTDSNGWKKFESANGPTPDDFPYLEVFYAGDGASYQLVSLTAPTATAAGSATLKVTNLGKNTWPAGGGYKLGYLVRQGGQTLNVATSKAAPTSTVGPMGAANITVSLPPLAPGSYLIDFTMFDTLGRSFATQDSVPYGEVALDASNVAPAVDFEQPASGDTVDSLTPSLYAEGTDPDNWPDAGLTYDFKVCSDPAGTQNCVDSGWTGRAWAVPPGTATWSNDYYWWVRAFDTKNAGPWVGPLVFTTAVHQPEITSHLAASPDGADPPGLEPETGDYSTSVTDVAVPTVGPDLTITRTYNSLDPRRDSAFGAGWSSRLDTRLRQDSDGSGNVVVTLSNAQEVRFGRNPDGSYAAPMGRNLTLVHDLTAGTYTLRDVTGTRRAFDAAGELVSIVDGVGRSETLSYDGAQHVTEIVNNASQRKLTLFWSGGHVISVTADQPDAQSAPLVWTYAYNGDLLAEVCDAATLTQCTHYAYATGSHYRSVVLDDNPRAYWQLGEATGATAGSQTARSPGDDAGTYTDVTLGAAGALAGTDGTAATFNGTSSYVVLPTKLVDSSMNLAVELWFRTTGGGVLLSYQALPFPTGNGTGGWVPILYVGTDGKLRGQFWNRVKAPFTTTGVVNDGQWHHVVLSAAVDTQTLYLDGVAQGTLAGPLNHLAMNYFYAGAGRTQGGWPGGNGADYYFDGSIDEVAFYQHPLGLSTVQAHLAARQPADELTQVTHPENTRVYPTLDYDTVNDRVHTLTDQNGATWTLDTPAADDGSRTVTLHGSVAADTTYTYDADHGGRLVSREHAGATRSLDYNTAGFLSTITDENGHQVRFTTDARGNVLTRNTCMGDNEDDPLLDCGTERFHYFLDSSDPLDPRNDKPVFSTNPAPGDSEDPAVGADTIESSYLYDTAGNVTERTDTFGGTIRVESRTYSAGTEAAVGGGTVPPGLLMSVSLTGAGVTSYTYLSTGDLAETVSPTGLHTRYGYDALGRIVSTTTAAADGTEFGTTSYTYTSLSQVDTVTAAPVTDPVTGVTHSLVTNYGYDADGNMIWTVLSDATGGDASRTTTYGFDDSDHLISIGYPDGGAESRIYDASGNLASQTDVDGVLTSYSYNDNHQLTETTVHGAGADPQDPDATSLMVESRAYDPAGRLASVTDAMGRQTDYTYFDDDTFNSLTLHAFHNQDGTTRSIEEREWHRFNGHMPTYVESAENRAVDFSWAGDESTGFEIEGSLGGFDGVDYTRDPAGNITRSEEWGSDVDDDFDSERSTDYTYDAAGNMLTRSVNNDGGVLYTTTYGRDERGLLTSLTDADGNTTDYGYDPTGALRTVTGPAVDAWVDGTEQAGVRPQGAIGRNAFGEITERRDPDGNVTTITRDSMGRPTAVTLPDYTPPGGTTPIHATYHATYDHRGNLLTLTDALGRVTSFDYDIYDRVLSRTDPAVGTAAAGVTRYGYDRDGETLSVTDPTGAVTRHTYDDLGRQVTTTQVERSSGAGTAYYTTTFGYDDDGFLTGVTTPVGETTTMTYDDGGNLVSRTDPAGHAWTYTYHLNGERLTATDPTGLVTANTYDLAGRVVSTSQTPAGAPAPARQSSATYDPVGNLLSTTSAEGRVVHFGYDPAGRPSTRSEVVDGSTEITTGFGYDPAGNRTRILDGNGHATDYSYNTWGLPESVIEPPTAATPAAADRTWTTSYDADGRPVGDVLPGGVTQTRAFDELGRVTSVQGSAAEAATTDRTFGYDLDGRVTSIGTPTGTTSYTYNDRGALLGAQGASGDASYTWDADGRLTGQANAAGSESFGYNADGTLASLTDATTGTALAYGYDNAGRLASIGYTTGGANLTRAYGYDALGRLASDVVSDGGTALVGTSYAYDLDDNLTGRTTTGTAGAGTTSYGYDGANRLISWTPPGGPAVAYGWDGAGNRVTAGATSYTFDERNRLLTDGQTTYTYTPRGTLQSTTSGGVTRNLAFDAFDRLVTDGGTQYGYDSLDRIASRDGIAFGYDDLSNWVVSDGASLIQRDPAGDPILDRPAAGGSSRVLYADRHGDVTAALSGAVVDASTTYDPFGKPTAATGTVPPVGFQSGWTEPDSGLVNMAARWYDPATGVFTSRDTVTVDPDPSAAANRYLYGDANPLTHSDPTGHEAAVCLVGLATGGPLGCAAGVAGEVVLGSLIGGVLGWRAGRAVHNYRQSHARSDADAASRAVDLTGTRDVYQDEEEAFLRRPHPFRFDYPQSDPPAGGGGPRVPANIRAALPPPPPPPPPLSVLNLYKDIPRVVGAVTSFLPSAVSATTAASVIIDRSAALSAEASKLTVCGNCGQVHGDTVDHTGAVACALFPLADLADTCDPKTPDSLEHQIEDLVDDDGLSDGDSANQSAVGFSTDDVARVTQHLARLDPSEANDVMLQRIEEAIDNGRPMSEGQTNFMRHELTEADLMDKGVPYDEAHAEALKTHPPGRNYDADVIDRFPEFGLWWRRMSGLDLN
ncbi:MAG TPA: DNRLRE domain-containing protein [Mycobacteriales bacterium]|nr:DNRLRE domain-containing protein [Mycobacteriales bacterium]